MPKKLKPEVRKEQIIKAAMTLAERDGYVNILRRDIAAEAGCGNGTINLHYGTMQQLRRDLIRHAIKQKNFVIIAQALMNRDPHVSDISDNLRHDAMMGAI